MAGEGSDTKPLEIYFIIYSRKVMRRGTARGRERQDIQGAETRKSGATSIHSHTHTAREKEKEKEEEEERGGLEPRETEKTLAAVQSCRCPAHTSSSEQVAALLYGIRWALSDRNRVSRSGHEKQKQGGKTRKQSTKIDCLANKKA